MVGHLVAIKSSRCPLHDLVNMHDHQNGTSVIMTEQVKFDVKICSLVSPGLMLCFFLFSAFAVMDIGSLVELSVHCARFFRSIACENDAMAWNALTANNDKFRACLQWFMKSKTCLIQKFNLKNMSSRISSKQIPLK